MTLIIATSQADAAYLVTDTANYQEDGTVCGLHSKITVLPGVAGAITYEGLSHPENVAKMAGALNIRTPRDLVRNLGTLAVELHAWTTHWNPNESRPEVLLCAIVHDPEIGPSAWIAHSGGALDRPGLSMGVPRRVAGYWNFGDPSVALGRKIVMNDPASFDVERDGIMLAEAARAGPWDDGPGHFVGGCVEITTVGPKGITTRQIQKWKDRIGHRIKP